jgi:hypothetical protein
VLTPLVFLTKVRTSAEKASARLLIDSLRTFGGEMSDHPFWVFAVDPSNVPCNDLAGPQVKVLPLSTPEAIKQYPFADKVFSCAQAESLVPTETRSLIWMDPDCLIVQPPRLFDLSADCDAALRPVHIRNIGLSLSEPLDIFWKGVYAAVGVDDVGSTVDSFVDRQRLRAYFNSHGLAINPARGLFRRWSEHFKQLVINKEFQTAACRDLPHRIFLFQAVFSTLAASALDIHRIRILPPTYNYPYNLQDQVPEDRRARLLNDLVCFTYEGRSIHPEKVKDIEIHDPLRSWLKKELLNIQE